MKPKNIFVSIDGVDGSGKTTVAKILASDGSFQYHKSPSGPFEQLRKEVDIRASPLERYCFYKLATQYDSSQINQFLKIGSVVCDRYIASTAAYHIAMDDRICLIHNNVGILKPNFAFLLNMRADIRDRRIRERKKRLSDVRIERDSAFLNRVAEIFRSFDLICIDTSNSTAEEVVKAIRRVVAQGAIA